MARPRKSEPNPVSDAVQKLREGLNQTQQEFAQRLGTAITTVARWETTRPPKGRALSNLNKLAGENNQWELAGIFGEALAEELGLSATLAERKLLIAEQSNCDDMLRHLELLNVTDDPVKANAELIYVSEELKKWRKRMAWRLSLPPRVPANSESVNDEQARPKERSDQK